MRTVLFQFYHLSRTRKKIIKESKAKFSLIDATHGRKTMSVIITDSENVILSYLDLKQIAAKFNVEVDDER